MVNKHIYVSLLLFLLAGCSVGRQRRVHVEKHEQSGIVWFDSLRYSLLSRQQEGRKITLSHLEFMPPDTNRQQAVKSITYSTIEERRVENTQSTLDSETRLQQTATAMEKSMQEKKISVKKEIPYLFIGIGIFILICIVSYIKCIS
ncbi:MAG: hypothetical protein LBH58_09750 [Tannerellaceae bacterium]|nr:hypothetical protein [Tannerellaceae bacterium]